MASVKGNIILNSINTLTGILFPLVTFPYAARVLLPEGIGAVNFLNSIVSYIILLTSLGIPLYGVREIAKYRDNRSERDRVTAEILILSTFMCLLGYVSVWILSLCVPQIHQQSALFYILSLSIVFTTIGANWFFQGIEDFKFITIRAVIIRTLAALALFVFVHDSSDLLIYGIITVGSTVGNNIVNFFYLIRHVSYHNLQLRELRVMRHLRPSLQVFVLNLIISLYVQLNTVMLGFMTSDDEVGYYVAGTKITHVALSIISSAGTVLLPRCSSLIEKKDNDGFASVIGKSIDLTIGLSMPIIAGLMILAVPVTLLFCGSEFMPSVSVLYLNAPLIVFMTLSNLFIIQILYPMNRIRPAIIAVSAGAATNILLNFAFIPSWGATGSALAVFFAELAVFGLLISTGKSFFPFRLSRLLSPRYAAASVLTGAAAYGALRLFSSPVYQLAVGTAAGIVVYAASLLIMKDPYALEFAQRTAGRLRKR